MTMISLLFDFFFRISCFMKIQYRLAEQITKSLFFANSGWYFIFQCYFLFEDLIDFLVKCDSYGFRHFIKYTVYLTILITNLSNCTETNQLFYSKNQFTGFHVFETFTFKRVKCQIGVIIEKLKLRKGRSSRDILYKRCFYKFSNIHRKAAVSEPPFNKVAGLRTATLF